MRLAWIAFVTGLLAGCAGGLAERQVELSQWVGQSEAQLVAAIGSPHRTYQSGATKFLTYEDVRVEQDLTRDFVFGPWPVGPAGFWGEPTTLVCDTTFAVSDGVVKGFSLRGNGCG